MLSVELTNLANMLDSVGQLKNVSQQARTWSSRISEAVYATTVRFFKLIKLFQKHNWRRCRLQTTYLLMKLMVSNAQLVEIHMFNQNWTNY